jgi:hypothetical protein
MKPRESEELIEKKKNLMVLSSDLYAPIFTMVFVPTNMKVKLSPNFSCFEEVGRGEGPYLIFPKIFISYAIRKL